MPNIPTLSSALQQQYQHLFDTMTVNPTRQKVVEQIVLQLFANKSRYEQVANNIKCPWFLIAAIHNLESSRSFKKHLHNGDVLTARTVHVPAGRPASGKPPFTWEESAVDALKLRGINRWTNWSIPGILYKLEEYNGWGYRMYHHHVLSPYLWSFSNHYQRGKYVEDGVWSDKAVSQQCGAAIVIRRLSELGHIEFDRAGTPATNGKKNLSPAELAPLVTYSITKFSDSALELQNALNKFPGIYVKPDGIPGNRTSDALKKVTGHYLKGDPRK